MKSRVASNVNDTMQRICREVVVAYFEILFQSEKTETNSENHQLQRPFSETHTRDSQNITLSPINRQANILLLMSYSHNHIPTSG
jgi:hypothetical protein